MSSSTSPNFMTADPRALAGEVAERELAQAIAWTEFYLKGLRDRQHPNAPDLGTLYVNAGITRVADQDLARLNDDSDAAQCRLETYRQGQSSVSPVSVPPAEPDSLDINLAEHSRLICEQQRLAAQARKQFHELHDAVRGHDTIYYNADDDGHFDRQGHVQESEGL